MLSSHFRTLCIYKQRCYSITKCKFQDNTDGIASNGGAVFLYGIAGDVRNTHCIFQNNSALSGGAVI